MGQGLQDGQRPYRRVHHEVALLQGDVADVILAELGMARLHEGHLNPVTVHVDNAPVEEG